MYDLRDKVTIVTGAGGMRGIGRAIALRLAREGAHVMLADIQRPPQELPPDEVQAGWRGIESVAQEIRALGQRVLPLVTDITQSAQVDRLVETTIREMGGIDILVNNARAIMGRDQALVVDLEESEWDRVMAVNAKGTFLCSRAVARYLVREDRRGKIINISSIAGKRGDVKRAAYSASKFAIIGFTQSLALELAPHRINVNAVCPGTVDTGRFNLQETLAAQRAGLAYEQFQAQRYAERARRIPLGRVATPEDVATMVAFLASPESDHITGQAFNVDGGEVMH